MRAQGECQYHGRCSTAISLELQARFCRTHKLKNALSADSPSFNRLVVTLSKSQPTEGASLLPSSV